MSAAARHPQAIVRDLAERAGLSEKERLDLQEETYFALIEMMLEGVEDPPPNETLADVCTRAAGAS